MTINWETQMQKIWENRVSVIVQFLFFIFLRCRNQGFGFRPLKFWWPINIHIELSK